MRFAVVELRKDGLRLSREEIAAAPAHCGELIISNLPASMAEGRPMTSANISHISSSTPYALVPPLFEPVLVRMQQNWFVLNGWQIQINEQKKCVHFRQEWLVRPSTPDLEAEHQTRVSKKAALVHEFGVDGMGN